MTTKPKQIDGIELHVAQRLRAARDLAGTTQEAAAVHLGITFQQVQKYEKGVNRISLGKLLALCDLYGTNIEWLLEGAPAQGTGDRRVEDIAARLLTTPGGRELAGHYVEISQDNYRSVVTQVAKAFASKSRSAA